MMDNWIDHIVLRRNAYAKFEVWGNKYGEDQNSEKLRWFEWNKTKNLVSPLAIKKAIEDKAEFLCVAIDMLELISPIASMDWATAAVIANNIGCEIPRLPTIETLREQRSLRSLGKVKIGVEWGYDMHDLTLSLDQWLRILGREPYVTDEPYCYEGKRFVGCWHFDEDLGLEVSYDDGGVGWKGKLNGIDVIDGPQLDCVDLAKLALKAVFESNE